MTEKNKGLADAQDGEFILNESGTTVSAESAEGVDVPPTNSPETNDKENSELKIFKQNSGDKEETAG